MDISTITLQLEAFEKTLDSLYNDMMPLVSQFTNLGRAVGGLGALIFISTKVWGHIARSEPIDVYPLLRPFLIGLCILLFPAMLLSLRGVTNAVSHGTDSLRDNQTALVDALQKQKKDIIDRRPENATFAIDDNYERELKRLSGITNIGDRMSLQLDKVRYEVNANFREWMRNVLELFHVAARLLISVLATFLLVVLSVLGPLTFGIGIFPGFGGSIPKWFGHFITVSLWVPVANIIGAMMATFQLRMLQGDIDRLNKGGGVDGADFGYMVFLVLAIICYFAVPKLTEWILDASGANNVAGGFTRGVTDVAGAAGAAGGYGVRGAAGAIGGSVGAAQQVGLQAGSAVRERAQGLVNRFR